MSNNQEVDVIESICGPFGKWQLRTILIIYLCKIPSSWFMACIIFTAPKPWPGEIYCDSGDIQSDSNDICIASREINNCTNDICVEKIPCESWKVNASLSEFESVTTEFLLVCSKWLYPAITQFFHLFGVLWGGIVATFMMRTCKISPRKTVLVGMITQIICGNLCGFAATVEINMFFRCMAAICCGLMYTAGALIFCDITSGVYRVTALCLFEQFWSIGLLILPILAHVSNSWTEIYVLISTPTVILIFLYPWIPDSPRWLLKHGEIETVKEILEEAIKVNERKCALDKDEIEFKLKLMSENLMNAPPEPSFWEMFEGKGVTKNIVCICLAWSVYIIIYYGFLLNVRPYGRDYIEVNTAICGIAEIIGTFVGLYFILHTTRKWLWTGLFNLVASAISFMAYLIPPHRTHRIVLLMMSSMPSKMAVSSTLNMIGTCVTELVGPEKKRLCAYFTVVYARVFLLLLPFIMSTDIYGELAAQTFITCMNVVAAIITMMISTPRTLLPRKPSVEKENNIEIYTVSKEIH